MEISKENQKRTSRIISFIKNNKIITTTVIIFCMFLSLNLTLIFNFIKILKNI